MAEMFQGGILPMRKCEITCQCDSWIISPLVTPERKRWVNMASIKKAPIFFFFSDSLLWPPPRSLVCLSHWCRSRRTRVREQSWSFPGIPLLLLVTRLLVLRNRAAEHRGRTRCTGLKIDKASTPLSHRHIWMLKPARAAWTDTGAHLQRPLIAPELVWMTGYLRQYKVCIQDRCSPQRSDALTWLTAGGNH